LRNRNRNRRKQYERDAPEREKLALRALDPLKNKMPYWFESVRLSTRKEDGELLVDLVVTIDIAKIFIQIKARPSEITKFRKALKERVFTILHPFYICDVVALDESIVKIKGRLLQKIKTKRYELLGITSIPTA